MTAEVTKLDRRHSGIEFFEYFITSRGRDRIPNILEFQQWRDWAQDTWGHGIERDWCYALRREISRGDQPARIWGWLTDDNKVGNQPRLYLRSDEELALFKLKWM
jgi:hypothetical protein